MQRGKQFAAKDLPTIKAYRALANQHVRTFGYTITRYHAIQADLAGGLDAYMTQADERMGELIADITAEHPDWDERLHEGCAAYCHGITIAVDAALYFGAITESEHAEILGRALTIIDHAFVAHKRDWLQGAAGVSVIRDLRRALRTFKCIVGLRCEHGVESGQLCFGRCGIVARSVGKFLGPNCEHDTAAGDYCERCLRRVPAVQVALSPEDVAEVISTPDRKRLADVVKLELKNIDGSEEVRLRFVSGQRVRMVALPASMLVKDLEAEQAEAA